MKITIQKTMNVQDPTRAHDSDAGLDLYVPEGQTCLVRRGAVYTIDLGVRIAIPDGYYGQLVLRSSAGKKGLIIPHGAGVIDSGYRGNLKVLVAALAEPVLVAARDRICQLIIHKLPAVELEAGVVDDSTDRGTGGFGSTNTGDTVRNHGKPDGVVQLTVGRLLRDLQDVAFRYGNDTPIVIPTTADADYEQAAPITVLHADRHPVRDDWDLFTANPAGEAVAVIS